jgi:hypothetical protein
MSQVNQLLESAKGSWKNLQSDAAKLAGKWGRTGLLEGLSEVEKNNMSLMLENQAKQLVTETNVIATNSTFTSGTEGENWAGIALPLVRKVFGSIVAKEFVSIQPMNMPSGLVFFLDFQYGNAKSPFALGESLYGTRQSGGAFPFATPSASGGLYGAGRFAYSTNQFSTTVPDDGSYVDAQVATTDFAAIHAADKYTTELAAGDIYSVTILDAEFKVTPNTVGDVDYAGARAFVFSTGDTGTQLSELTTVTYDGNGAATGVIFYFDQAGNVPITGAGTLLWNKATKDDERGDFEADQTPPAMAVQNAALATNISIPEINVKMQSQAITAKTKKLKAVWTPEFAQDLAAYQNIDAEAELTNIMSEYISMEIDLEILDMLIEDAAAGTEYWSAENNQVWNGSAFANATSGFYNTQGGWFQTLGTKMQKLSNKIHQLTLRGGANFIVTSPTVATILESIPGFASNSNGDAAQGEYAFGVQKVGTINNRYKVYKNPYFTDNLILMGYRGSQFLETGAVFAPYIPLIMTPLVYDPETFTPRKGLMTRYAKKMLRPEYYGKIYVGGLNSI